MTPEKLQSIAFKWFETFNNKELEKLLAKVELNIREQEAMLKLLEKQLADPANHEDLENSARLAEEYEKMKKEIDKLMLKWEELMAAEEE